MESCQVNLIRISPGVNFRVWVSPHIEKSHQIPLKTWWRASQSYQRNFVGDDGKTLLFRERRVQEVCSRQAGAQVGFAGFERVRLEVKTI